MPSWDVPHTPDPNLHAGPFRVLQRTDGKYVVLDERLPFGQRDLLITGRVSDAEKYMRHLAEQEGIK